MTQLTVNVRKEGDVLVFSPEGRLDTTNEGTFQERLLESIEQGEKAVILDFSNTHYISSAGLRVIITVAQRLEKAREKIVLVCTNASLLQLFQISGFGMLFSICGSVEEALKLCEGETEVP